jgi:hypothetical protein
VPLSNSTAYTGGDGPGVGAHSCTVMPPAGSLYLVCPLPLFSEAVGDIVTHGMVTCVGACRWCWYNPPWLTLPRSPCTLQQQHWDHRIPDESAW